MKLLHNANSLPPVVAVAHLAMEDVVVQRGKVSGRSSFKLPLTHLPSRGSASGPVEIQLGIDLQRKVQCKAWGRIMQNVLGKGASAFFVKKMGVLLTKIEEQVRCSCLA